MDYVLFDSNGEFLETKSFNSDEELDDFIKDSSFIDFIDDYNELDDEDDDIYDDEC